MPTADEAPSPKRAHMITQHVVVLSGAGISAESGLGTFRGSGGLWEGYKISEVATPEGWQHDFKKVLQFYNERRQKVALAAPNEAHTALAKLEEVFKVGPWLPLLLDQVN